MDNIFDAEPFDPAGGEQFETIIEKGSIYMTSGFRLERILSFGQATAEGVWFEQGWNEWVVIARGSAVLEFEDGKTMDLSLGDHLEIKAGVKHRVVSVSDDCVWLALNYKCCGSCPCNNGMIAGND